MARPAAVRGAAPHIATGLQCHKAGDLAGALAAYGAAVTAEPDNADALHLLGVAYHLAKDSAAAVPLLKSAAARAPRNAEMRSNLGAALYATGDLAGAADAFAAAARIDPGHLDAHANLAAALVRLGRTDDAIAAFAAAYRLKPDSPRFAKRLGELCLERDRLAEAADWFARALAIRPDDADVLNNLAFACERLDRSEEAEAYYRRALALRPESPEIASNLAATLRRLGRAEEARSHFERAIAAPAAAWEDPANLAGALCNGGLFDRALPIFAALTAQRPDDARLHADHGHALIAAGRREDAEPALRRALALDPSLVEARLMLGACLQQLGRTDEAIAMLAAAVDSAPAHLRARLSLCSALFMARQIDEACAAASAAMGLPDFRKSMFVVPHQAFRAACAFDDIETLEISLAALDGGAVDAGALSAGFLECLVVARQEDEIAALAALHRRWGTAEAAEAAASPLPALGAARGGRIRIGLMSSDLRSHSVGRFVLPLIDHYDRERLEFYCYAPAEAAGDSVQRRIRDQVAAFRQVGGLSHRDLAAAIRADEIDVLLELNGFTAESRLKALAWRAAPVQVYWLGYPFTTGLPTMDYILLDRDLAPERAEWLVEKPLLMPGSWVCYDPFEIVPVLPAPPQERNGHVTFGTLNNPYKFTRAAIALWAQAMNAVPQSRFLLVRPECASAALRRNLTAEFARHGIAADRLGFVNNKTARLSHFAWYDEIDISLDSFPLTGGTTTADALWMGVPVVTLVGPSYHQRISYAILRRAGLDDLCTRSEEEFVARAVALAGDPARLRRLRAELRPRLAASPLCRGEDFARDFADLMTGLAARHGLR